MNKFIRILKIPVFYICLFGLTFYYSCDKNENQDSMFPNMNIYDIRPLSATARCETNSEYAWSIEEKGVCWSTHPNPTIYDSKAIGGRDTGVFVCFMNFTPNTQYYVSLYYIIKGKVTYQTQDLPVITPKHYPIVFGKAPLTYDSITDIEGNIYKTIQIGNRKWMAENLKTTKFRSGKAIPKVEDKTLWRNQTEGAYSEYLNMAVNAETYGKLYNWAAVNSPDSICPNGWHVASDDDWKDLELAAGIRPSNLDNIGERGAQTSGPAEVLNEVMTDYYNTHWISSNAAGGNTTGFTAIPAGYRDISGNYLHIEKEARWWTKTEFDAQNAWGRFISGPAINRSYINKKHGLSIRCVMN